jgi:hypothetical protein
MYEQLNLYSYILHYKRIEDVEEKDFDLILERIAKDIFREIIRNIRRDTVTDKIRIL